MIQTAKQKFNGTAVDLNWKPARTAWLTHVMVTFDTKPSTAGNLVITIVDEDDADLNIILDSENVARNAFSSPLIYEPDSAIPINFRESVRVQYPNEDGRVVGVKIKGSDTHLGQ